MKLEQGKTKEPRIHLLPFGEQHLRDPRYLEWLKRPSIARRIGRPEYLRSFSATRIRQQVRRLQKTPGYHFFAVLDGVTKVFFGTAKIQFFDPASPRAGIADIGLMIGDSKFRGRRLSREILGRLCYLAFRRFHARKLTAGVIAGNAPALRVFLRTGFRLEGRLRRQVRTGGRPQDHLLLGCFPSELRWMK